MPPTPASAVPPLRWFKSSYSGSSGSDCVEVALSAEVHVRDSKDPQGAALAFTPEDWAGFVAGVNAGEFVG